jgi:hypothetical protein
MGCSLVPSLYLQPPLLNVRHIRQLHALAWLCPEPHHAALFNCASIAPACRLRADKNPYAEDLVWC